MRKLKLSELTRDYHIYPRKDIKNEHVTNLKEAIEAEEILPPIVVEATTKRIVDGFHRYEAYVQLFDMSHKVPVIERKYRNEAELFLDSIRLNAAHGLTLDRVAKAKCAQKCRDLGLDDEQIAKALKMSTTRVQEILAEKTAYKANGKTPVILKGNLKYLRGKRLTKKQAEAVEKVGGWGLAYYVSQVITYLDGGLVDEKNEKMMDALLRLKKKLDEFLEGVG